MTSVSFFHRSLDQELLALLRGASLECLVCGEFVLHEGPHVRCPECGMRLNGRIELADAPVQSETQAG